MNSLKEPDGTEEKILHLAEIDSTNTYARAHFEELEDGLLVSASYQTAGRGRLGRKWVSPPDTNVTATFVMKNVKDAFLSTCVASLAVLETLRSAAPGMDLYVKWPNDVYAEDAKIAGILSEGVLSGGKISGIVTGMGINVNLSAEEVARIDQRAVSLKMLTGRDFCVKKIVSELAKSLKRCYILYSNFPETLFQQWKRENRLLGRNIVFDTPDGRRITGIMEEILDDGSIRVKSGADEFVFRCGDIRIVKDSWLKKE